jgi:hypothetical protein
VFDHVCSCWVESSQQPSNGRTAEGALLTDGGRSMQIWMGVELFFFLPCVYESRKLSRSVSLLDDTIASHQY